MRPILTALLVATLATTARPAAAEAWEPHQLALGAAAVGLHLADWGQTRHIAASNGRWVESMPITRDVIGENPTTARVDLYMLGTGALFLGAAHLMPDYRTAILAFWVVSRLSVVVSNHAIGLRIGGSF